MRYPATSSLSLLYCNVVADKLDRMFQVPPVNLSQDFVAGITLSVTTWTGNYCQVPPPAGARDPRMTTPLEQQLVSGPLRHFIFYTLCTFIFTVQ